MDTAFHHTEATKQKLSEMRRGKRNPFAGRKHTDAAKAKMAEWARRKNAMRQYDLQGITIKDLTPELWAYIAGLVDGEGSIALHCNYPQIFIYNCCQRVQEFPA